MTNPPFLLSTDRLFLRHFRMEDVPTLVAYRNDPAVALYQSWESMSEVTARHFIAEMSIAQPGVTGEWFQFAVERRDTGEQIGDVALHTMEDRRLGEIGYTFARHAQGHGFATEAVRAVLDYAFDTIKMHRVAATVDPDNAPSIRLLERLGFRHEGTLIEAGWFHGKWCSDHIYAILEREWLASRKS